MIINFKKYFLYSCFVALLFGVRACAFEGKSIQVCAANVPIEDELIKSENFNNIKPVYVKDIPPIVDDIIEPIQQAGQTIMLWAQKKGDKVNEPIEDELVTSAFKKKNDHFLRKQKNIIEDTFVKTSLDLKTLSLIKKREKYDFSKEQVPIELKVVRNLSTKKDLREGQVIVFRTIRDVVINGKVLPKGTRVSGKVEVVSESDKMGTPFNIVIDNFNVKNPENVNETINFHGTVAKSGANRTLWVYPLYQAGNLVLYVAGFAFVPIHGGHAKLLTNETFTVFYEAQ